jgi:hypothetical protein
MLGVVEPEQNQYQLAGVTLPYLVVVAAHQGILPAVGLAG